MNIYKQMDDITENVSSVCTVCGGSRLPASGQKKQSSPFPKMSVYVLRGSSNKHGDFTLFFIIVENNHIQFLLHRQASPILWPSSTWQSGGELALGRSYKGDLSGLDAADRGQR